MPLCCDRKIAEWAYMIDRNGKEMMHEEGVDPVRCRSVLYVVRAAGRSAGGVFGQRAVQCVQELYALCSLREAGRNLRYLPQERIARAGTGRTFLYGAA